MSAPPGGVAEKTIQRGWFAAPEVPAIASIIATATDAIDNVRHIRCATFIVDSVTTSLHPSQSLRAVGDHLGDRMRDARVLRSGRDDEDVLADGRTAVVAGPELRVPERAAVGRREGGDAPVVAWGR